MKKLLSKIISRLSITLLLIAIQAAWGVAMLSRASAVFPWINRIFGVISIFVAIYIINRNANPSYKIAWIVPILIFPLFGVSIYLLYGNKKPTRAMRKKFKRNEYILRDNLPQSQETLDNMDTRDACRASYLLRYNYPVYGNTQTEYFPSGEAMFPRIIEEISKAEKFIFLEYFIIEEGTVWNTIRDILAKKAAEGVDVRVIYDDVGSVGKLPAGYALKLSSLGIKCVAFNPFVPFFSVIMNNRDHRKILVVDGHTAFTGGINLADEYMNITHPFGYWKDTAVLLHGEAAWSFTCMFLQMWQVIRGKKEDASAFRPDVRHAQKFSGNGFVQPFSDSPLDDEAISENVYIDIISAAEKYVYICTPYLVIDDQMKNALTLAAKRGVDVRIITPGIPDKKIIYRLTRSYYGELLRDGVKIYEYSPGFLHEKAIVSDDRCAVVGTINMDFRSLYLHFECGVLMTNTAAVFDVRDDTLSLFPSCREVEKVKRKNIPARIFDSILRTFAPLL
ncbi:MAG: cardiolipin synthase [Ruminococcaceae bacterium]|nr:cardiolipin synthase [Oscillospiraceae bacterium]